MNSNLKKAMQLLKQEIKYAKTSESDSLTGIIARFDELEKVVKNCSIPYVVGRSEQLCVTCGVNTTPMPDMMCEPCYKENTNR